MTVTILTPPASELLTTVAHVEQELGVTFSEEDQFLVERYIQQASAAIQSHCGRRFGLATYLETVAGYGDTRLLLSEIPIVAVTEVLSNNNPVVDYVADDLEAGIMYRRAGWNWSTGIGWGLVPVPRPGTEAPTYSFTYSAGYELPTDVDPGTLPGDVERAAIITVKSYWNNRKRNVAVSSKRIGDVSINYINPSKEEVEYSHGLPPEAVGLLGPFRR